jgi:hypothetical protein
MAGIDISKKVKSGLSKAIKATSSNDADLVYLEVKARTDGTPMSPGVETAELVLLKDAIFKSYSKGLIDNSLIMDGDRMLVCNGDVVISQNQTIKVGNDRWLVKSVDEKTPAGVPLAYIAQVRKQ